MAPCVWAQTQKLETSVKWTKKFLDSEFVETVCFLDPETAEKLQFLDKEIIKMVQTFLDPENVEIV